MASTAVSVSSPPLLVKDICRGVVQYLYGEDIDSVYLSGDQRVISNLASCVDELSYQQKLGYTTYRYPNLVKIGLPEFSLRYLIEGFLSLQETYVFDLRMIRQLTLTGTLYNTLMYTHHQLKDGNDLETVGFADHPLPSLLTKLTISGVYPVFRLPGHLLHFRYQGPYYHSNFGKVLPASLTTLELPDLDMPCSDFTQMPRSLTQLLLRKVWGLKIERPVREILPKLEQLHYVFADDNGHREPNLSCYQRVYPSTAYTVLCGPLAVYGADGARGLICVNSLVALAKQKMSVRKAAQVTPV